ncbi:(NiFe) hydrogenase maturation protein HypF [Dethiosulfovibrio peptidovorans DSM 11002]|uniref:Carbamoyltransferase n=1 Tax=Dethiosulfovibrio peptidovorans DSM 11002 TaxID=469381 RepID=D2Z443_9BACT|nr:carbamoyltransferase HypF [Dethiosulfovibrio peptidovorans]EFC92304.1 (NiFe) hydrogenase maturation protein HypF [Dethiosulfovibrio peptidovorans DSM 11002]
MTEKEILVTGVVQGVGFRPFCAKLASSLGLGGSVINSSDGVVIVLRGTERSIDNYIKNLKDTKPDPADIHSITIISERKTDGDLPGAFVIGKSRRTERQRVLIPPDIGTCDRCLAEMRDPSDRRYRYPFINCTDCGPRFSIVSGLPYDRPKTTMSIFPMCDRCNGEYTDQENRRYHAQPNACADCGPSVWFQTELGEPYLREDGIGRCREYLKAGKVVAIKGLGGFHLACDPFEDTPVSTLRHRKGRPDKPLAIMAESLESAREIALISEEEARLLKSSRRPIVLCEKKTGSVAESVAPGQNSVGIMLPYTPLHHLILEGMRALVMTSANPTDSPLISDNEEALSRLAHVADGFLMHNRDICMKVDDSLVALSGDRTVMLRRGRGYVPNPIDLSISMPHILAAGAEMKSTFSLTQEGLIFPSQYLGDAKQMDTLGYYRQTLDHFTELYNIRPKALAYDAHPLYLSTQTALKALGEVERSMAVQHHHAHLAACLAEYDINEPTIGVIMDGTGYGSDGTIWGGEFLLGDWSGYRRLGHFKTAGLPGGDRSVLEPWRYSLSLLTEALGEEEAIKEASRIWQERSEKAKIIVKTMNSSPLTSSCGRLFDGVSAILGGRDRVSYDGQAAMELEARSSYTDEIPVDMGIWNDEDGIILDWRPFIRWLVEEKPTLDQGGSAFHASLAKSISEICTNIAKDTGVKKVALSGGVWQNRMLLRQTVVRLEGRGFSVLTHRRLSPNDESVSVGQAAIAGWRWRI